MKKFNLLLIALVVLMSATIMFPQQDNKALAGLPDRFVVVEDGGSIALQHNKLPNDPCTYIVKDKVLGTYYIYTLTYMYRGEAAIASTTMIPLLDVDGKPKTDYK